MQQDASRPQLLGDRNYPYSFQPRPSAIMEIEGTKYSQRQAPKVKGFSRASVNNGNLRRALYKRPAREFFTPVLE